MATISRPSRRRTAAGKTIQTGPCGPWHPSAPRTLRTTYQAIGDGRWPLWQKYLTERPRRWIGEQLKSRRSPLAWSLSDELPAAAASEVCELIELLAHVRRGSAAEIARAADRWLALSAHPPFDAAFALAALAWAHALVDLASQLAEQHWWRLFEALVEIASRSSDSVSLTAQLCECELPLALTCLFPELAASCDLLSAAQNTADRLAAEFLDGDGLMKSRYLPWLRPLVASWTRCGAMAAETRRAWCDTAAARAFPALVQQAHRLSRADGRQVFSPANSETWDADLVKHAIRTAGDTATRQIRQLTTMGRSTSRPDKRLPAPAIESEAAALAVLRPSWHRRAPQLSACYRGPQLAVELSAGGRQLLSGGWDVSVHLDGVPLAPRGNWEQVCWLSDDEVDYLELNLELDEEVTIERHLVMARHDPVILLADAVLGIRQAAIDYRGSLSLAAGAAFRPEVETREGWITSGGRPRARVLPVALGEWRSAPSCGSLFAADGRLELRQKTDGEGQFAPLLIDVNPRRAAREATWRQLTVAEDRQLVAPDAAVGYRAQADKAQWLIYRSLSPPAIRTVLGANLMHEFFFARFEPGGTIERLVEIEEA